MKAKLILGSIFAFASISIDAQNWSLTGNAGTVDGTNFIGTTDNIPFSIKVNNQKSGRIDHLLGNNFFGYLAGNSNTTGGNNSSFGFYALTNNSTSDFNSAFGSSALYQNTGATNSAFGAVALYNNTSGASNSAFGFGALNYNTTGSSNVGMGTEALRYNTTGSYNISIGRSSMPTNVTGSFNLVLGSSADVGASNLTNATAIGAYAIVTTNNAIQLGDNNVTQIFGGTSTTAKFIVGGLQITGGSIASGKVLTSDGSGNATWQTPSGGGSGWSLTGNAGTVDGTNFIGTTDNVPFNIRVNNQTAGRIDQFLDNTFLGYNVGIANSSPLGAGNSVFGSYAFVANTTGRHNTASGWYSLSANLSGYNNTCSGTYALATNTSGANNTAIGAYADVSAGNLINAAALGSGAIVNASNKVVIGTSSPTMVIGGYAPAGFSNLSDGRFKENIKEEVPGLNFIVKLRPVSYNVNTRKLDEYLMQNMPDSIKALHIRSAEVYLREAAMMNIGFIAQEVEGTVKELGVNFDGVNVPKNPTDNYSIGYAKFVVPLVKAVQEQQQMIEAMKQEIKELKNSKTSTSENKTTGVNQLSGTENESALEQNIPNPFTHETVIKYTLPQQVNTAYMAIYDLTGKQVTSFVLSQRGSSVFTLSSEKLAAGIYIYSIIADGIILDSKRMVVAEK